MIAGFSRPGVARKEALKVTVGNGTTQFTDTITVEEPLEIIVSDKHGHEVSAGIIMRTPVMDDCLAAGFLFTEGIIRSIDDISAMEGIDCDGVSHSNRINVTLAENVQLQPANMGGRRYINSSCGVCGKGSIDQVFMRVGKIQRSDFRVRASVIASLPDSLWGTQGIFSSTGGLHAAGLFSGDGSVVCSAEDVGRHNAVDKVIGRSLMNGCAFDHMILQVSGRAGFEIIEKAAVAGIPIIGSISAPSSLAVETCETLGMTLLGFVRGKSFNIYSGTQRIIV
ncbi:MAG: formate dehydrogenase accessory sulfurtransferase FdhD [Candidatus Thermoplasmatota archaeon]|nr:formate dehydrogenase accessory sulfurtransferase FdhD [Candidatus Thermoplasmatota archaeon]